MHALHAIHVTYACYVIDDTCGAYHRVLISNLVILQYHALNIAATAWCGCILAGDNNTELTVINADDLGGRSCERHRIPHHLGAVWSANVNNDELPLIAWCTLRIINAEPDIEVAPTHEGCGWCVRGGITPEPDVDETAGVTVKYLDTNFLPINLSNHDKLRVVIQVSLNTMGLLEWECEGLERSQVGCVMRC